MLYVLMRQRKEIRKEQEVKKGRERELVRTKEIQCHSHTGNIMLSLPLTTPFLT